MKEKDFDKELYKKNRRAVKKYLKWREQANREEPEEPEEPEAVNEYRLEITSLTCK